MHEHDGVFPFFNWIAASQRTFQIKEGERAVQYILRKVVEPMQEPALEDGPRVYPKFLRIIQKGASERNNHGKPQYKNTP